MDAQALSYSQDIVRTIMFLLSMATCTAFAWVGWRRPEWRLLIVAPVSWTANLGVFNLCRLFDFPANVLTANMWSQTIHFHALILLIGGLILYVRK